MTRSGFTARSRSGVAELSLYDKERQLEKIGHPSDEAHGILRAEYRILNVNKIKRKHEITLTNSDTLLWFINNSDDLLYEIIIIVVHPIANHNDYYIKFIVNLQKVLVADGLVKIINESNAQEAIEMVNWQLSNWLGDEFEINRLKLSRVDICSNIDVGSAELVS